MTVVDLHVAPAGDAALVDVAGQLQQLLVVVLQAVGAEGLVHTGAAQGHGYTLVPGQHAQQQDTQELQENFYVSALFRQHFKNSHAVQTCNNSNTKTTAGKLFQLNLCLKLFC